nr:SGNH/GDSL hydrolase family protein [Rhodococcus sp. 15-1154-1]
MDAVTLGMAKADAARKYNLSGLPTAVGARSKTFDKARSLYNVKGTNTFAIRAALANALTGAGLATLTFQGDSKTAGFGTNAGVSINGAASMPGRIRSLLASRGYPIAGTGPVFCNQNPGGGTGDSRWAFSAGWTVSGLNANFASANTAGRTATFTSDLPGTVVEIYSLSNSAPFQYTIDGGAPVTVTPSGTNSLHVTTLTGLSDTIHTIVITTTGTATVYVLAVNVRRTVGLQILNNAICGSTTINWAGGTQFYQSKRVAELMPTDGVFISLGTNDGRSAVPIATYKTNLGTLIAGHQALGRQVGLIVPSPVSTAQISASDWNARIAAMYDVADTYDLPLVDLTDVYGTYDAANAKGLFFDNLHEKEAGYATNAATVLGALAA